MKNRPFGQYAPSISITSQKTSLFIAQYQGQQMYPTIDQWGNPIPPITAADYGTTVIPQQATTGPGFKAPMLINGFLPKYSGYASSLPFMFQSTPSSYALNTLNLTFSVYSQIENSSALTLSGMAGVTQPDGSVPVQSVLCYTSNFSQICGGYSNASFVSDVNGSTGQASWQGSLSSLIFYIPQSIPPSVLISISFNLLNPRCGSPTSVTIKEGLPILNIKKI